VNLARLPVVRIVGDVRSGSSRPLVVETARGRFFLKLVGGAEGPKVLAAEWIANQIARALLLPSLEVEALLLDPALAAPIEESELREAVIRGAGLCLGVREFAGSAIASLEVLEGADDDFALRLYYFDTLIDNPDRRRNNPNVLRIGNALIPIDHGAALPFQHDWKHLSEERPLDDAPPPLHLYASRHERLRPRFAELHSLLTREALAEICRSVPDEWLGNIVFESPDRQRSAYAAFLWKRHAHLTAPHTHRPVSDGG